MATNPKKITELDETTTIASTSWFVLADTAVTTPTPSGTATGPTGTDYKISPANLAKGLLPSQSGQAGKVLSTNGTSLSWAVDATGGSLPADVAYVDHANTFTVSPQTIVADTDAHKGLIVKAHSPTQSANLQEWQDSTGATKVSITPRWHMGLGGPTDSSVLLPGSPYDATLQVTETKTDPSVDYPIGVGCDLVFNPSADAPNAFPCGVHTAAHSASGNSRALGNVVGLYSEAVHEGTGAVGTLAGIYFTCFNVGGGAVSYQYASYNIAGNRVGTADNLYGTNTQAYNLSAGLVTNLWGLSVGALNGGGPITNCYGIGIDDQSSITSTNNWNIFSDGATSQNTFVGSVLAGGTTKNDAAAILQADSTTKGFLPPRMTTTQRNAIASPPEGLVLYNTTSHKLTYRNNSTWIEV